MPDTLPALRAALGPGWPLVTRPDGTVLVLRPDAHAFPYPEQFFSWMGPAAEGEARAQEIGAKLNNARRTNPAAIPAVCPVCRERVTVLGAAVLPNNALAHPRCALDAADASVESDGLVAYRRRANAARPPKPGTWIRGTDGAKHQVERIAGLDRVRCTDGAVYHVGDVVPCPAPAKRSALSMEAL